MTSHPPVADMSKDYQPIEHPRWLLVLWHYGRFAPHLLIAASGVWTIFVPPLSLETTTSAVARVLWCVLLVVGAVLASYGLQQSDERPRVVGLFAEGVGYVGYALALVGRESGVLALSMGALAAFLFKSCIYAALRLRAERERYSHGGRLRPPGAR